MNEYQATKALDCSRKKYDKAMDDLRNSGELRNHMQRTFENTIIRVMSVRSILQAKAQQLLDKPNKENILLNYCKQMIYCDETVMKCGHMLGFSLEPLDGYKERTVVDTDYYKTNKREIIEAHFQRIKALGA